MLSLHDHLFPVRAHFDSSLVVTFAVPAAWAATLLPPCVSPDTHGTDTAFVAAAMVATRQLRPAGLPAFLGQSFFLIGYRVFVRYRSAAGKHLRGLYILRSETDRRRMQLLGNLFTHYGYTTTDIRRTTEGSQRMVRSVGSDFHVTVDTAEAAPPLPPGSCFTDWKQARRFAGPLPFTFTYKPQTREVLIVEGVRQHWQPQPVRLVEQHFGWLATLGLEEARPASAFLVTDVPYYWRAGKTEPWTP